MEQRVLLKIILFGVGGAIGWCAGAIADDRRHGIAGDVVIGIIAAGLAGALLA